MAVEENKLPPRLQEIIGDFSVCDGQEKLELLLEFSDNMPPLPDSLQKQRDRMEQVHECMTPVFVHAELQDGGMVYHFDIPPEAPTVRGYAALLKEGLAGALPEQIMSLPPDFYRQMGIQDVVGPQRLNGITALLARLKRLAFKQMQQNQNT
jgi:cysteine desulfuration protein SufE